MAASSNAEPGAAAPSLVTRYYLAMGVPFAIDVATSIVYVLINRQPLVFLPMVAMSSVFLVAGVGIGAWLLFRPIHRFIAGDLPFPAIEQRLAILPRSSALLVACLYAPMLALRLLSPRFGITFGADVETPTWIDTVTTFV